MTGVNSTLHTSPKLLWYIIAFVRGYLLLLSRYGVQICSDLSLQRDWMGHPDKKLENSEVVSLEKYFLSWKCFSDHHNKISKPN